MTKRKTAPPPVIRDSREKEGHGWSFDKMQIGALKTGDYSLKGYEHVFAVERKGSAVEFVANITQKDKWQTFKAELERLDRVQAGFVVLEFDMRAIKVYPEETGLPWSVRRKIRVTPEFYLKRFLEIEMHFKSKFILAGADGRDVFLSLCKRVLEKWPQPPPVA